MELTARSGKILQRMLLIGAGWLLVGMLLSGSVSASETGEQSGQEGQVLIVVGKTVANRPMSLSGKPRKRCKGGGVRANEPPDPDDEPIVIEIRPKINLGYGVIRAGVHEGSLRSDMESKPSRPCLGKRG